MTTGRINQVSIVLARGAPAGAGVPGHNPRRGRRQSSWKGRRAPGHRTPTRRTAGPVVTIQLPPLTFSKVPSAAGGCRTPVRAPAGCDIGAPGGGYRTRGHAGERRLPRGASPRESGCRCWPAANDPQTPPVPEAQGPPGFGRPVGRLQGRGSRGDARRAGPSGRRRGGSSVPAEASHCSRPRRQPSGAAGSRSWPDNCARRPQDDPGTQRTNVPFPRLETAPLRRVVSPRS